MEQANGGRRYLPEKRMEIMKQHLLEKKALSAVCDVNGIHPTMYYRWLKELLSNAVYAFGKGKDKECREWKNKALELEKKLTRKNEVLSELMEEHVAHYNVKRLQSAIGYIAPQDKLLGREKEIFSERDQKLSEARERRAAKRKIA